MNPISSFPYRMVRLNCLLCLLFFIPFFVDAQNFLLDKKESLFHGSAEISYNNFGTSYGIFPAYTYKGRLTVGTGIGKDNDAVNKLNSTYLRPFVSYLVLKQEEEGMPFGLDLHAAYQFNYVTQVIFNISSLRFGTNVYYEIAPIGNVKVIPSIGVEAQKAISGNPQFQEEIVWSYGGQTTLLWDTYYLTPKLTITDGIATVYATLGVLFR